MKKILHGPQPFPRGLHWHTHQQQLLGDSTRCDETLSCDTMTALRRQRRFDMKSFDLTTPCPSWKIQPHQHNDGGTPKDLPIGGLSSWEPANTMRTDKLFSPAISAIPTYFFLQG